jgi:hypothetical protein
MKRSFSIGARALFVTGMMGLAIVSGVGRAAGSGGVTLVPGPCISIVVQPPPYGVTTSSIEFTLHAKITSCSSNTQTNLVVAYGTNLIPIQDVTVPGGWPTMTSRCTAPQTSGATTGLGSGFALSPGASVTVACNLFLAGSPDLETGIGAVYGNATTFNDVNNNNPRFYSVDGITLPLLLATSNQIIWLITEAPMVQGGGGRPRL